MGVSDYLKENREAAISARAEALEELLAYSFWTDCADSILAKHTRHAVMS
jgi:hypothetical protein